MTLPNKIRCEAKGCRKIVAKTEAPLTKVPTQLLFLCKKCKDKIKYCFLEKSDEK